MTVLADRINELIKYSKLTIPKFAIAVGAKTPQAIREILKGNTKSLSPSMAKGILDYMPEVSHFWLLAGEGEMLRSAEKNDAPAEAEPQPSPSEMLAAIVAKLDAIEKRLADECAQRDRLMGIVENQQNLIAKLAEVGVMEKTL